jgi:hypothetical protein
LLHHNRTICPNLNASNIIYIQNGKQGVKLVDLGLELIIEERTKEDGDTSQPVAKDSSQNLGDVSRAL